MRSNAGKAILGTSRPSRALVATLARLKISKEVMLSARNIAGSERQCRLRYTQWVNDVVGSRGSLFFEASIKNPEKAFIAWVKRLEQNPYALPHRAFSVAVAVLGAKEAERVLDEIWPKLVDSARNARLHPDDLTSCLAGLWLQAVRDDALMVLRGILHLVGDVKDPYEAQLPAPITDMHPRAVSDLFHGTPQDLWRRHAAHIFPAVASETAAKLGLMARQARREGKKEGDGRLNATKAARLRHSPPSLSMAVLGTLLRKGLNAEDIYWAESRFLQDISQNRLLIAPKSDGLQEFLKYAISLPKNAGPLDHSEIMRRRRNFSILSFEWARALPVSLRQLGAARKTIFTEWLADLGADLACPPADLRLAYAVWLLQRRRPSVEKSPQASLQMDQMEMFPVGS